MKKYVLVHIPHSSLYIPSEYKKTSLISLRELEEENKFMCDFRMDELIDDKSQAVIFPYSRLYCDVERFKGDEEVMNKYGMGYIYTRTSKGKAMFEPNAEHRTEVEKIYDEHHKMLDERVRDILDKYGKCVIIDLHSYSADAVLRLFGYSIVPDVCIGVEETYYSKELVDFFVAYFKERGYSVEINYPYKGSLVPNAYYGKKNTNIVSVMLEFNKRVYEEDFDEFKELLTGALECDHM